VIIRIFSRALFAMASVGCTMITLAGDAAAQPAPQRGQPRGELKLVTSFGPGAIQLPRSPEWKPEMLTVYDEGRRPVAQFSNEARQVGVSYLMFENLSGTPNANGCREDAISPLVKNGGKRILERKDEDAKLADGTQTATTWYLLTMGEGGAGRQRNLFAFAGNAKTCAEMHISSVVDTPEQRTKMRELIAEFHPNLEYQPTALDYFHLGQLLFKNAPKLAGPYFRASLGAMPADASYTTPRRMTTDQLVMALGLGGDVKGGRAVAEKAVAADPDYPINYYNLACADAEAGDAVNARKHLQDAFDRRKNVLQGESMPDPAIDDSIMKLKNDKAFWEFVLSLPKS
jgi:hypothetical protein